MWRVSEFAYRSASKEPEWVAEMDAALVAKDAKDKAAASGVPPAGTGAGGGGASTASGAGGAGGGGAPAGADDAAED